MRRRAWVLLIDRAPVLEPCVPPALRRRTRARASLDRLKQRARLYLTLAMELEGRQRPWGSR